jgi:hypothetical protein
MAAEVEELLKQVKDLDLKTALAVLTGLGVVDLGKIVQTF